MSEHHAPSGAISSKPLVNGTTSETGSRHRSANELVDERARAERRAAAEAETIRRARESAAEALEVARIRDDVSARMDAERIARELDERLERAAQARVASQIAHYEQAERIARSLAEQRKGRVSHAGAIAAIGLALAAIATGAFIAHAQTAADQHAAELAVQTPIAVTPAPSNEGLRQAIRDANARTAEAQAATQALLARTHPRATTNSTPGPHHVRVVSNTRTVGDPALEQIEGGPDPVSSNQP